MLAPHDPVREILRAHLLPQVSPHQRHAHEPPVHSRHSKVLKVCGRRRRWRGGHELGASSDCKGDTKCAGTVVGRISSDPCPCSTFDYVLLGPGNCPASLNARTNLRTRIGRRNRGPTGQATRKFTSVMQNSNVSVCSDILSTYCRWSSCRCRAEHGDEAPQAYDGSKIRLKSIDPVECKRPTLCSSLPVWPWTFDVVVHELVVQATPKGKETTHNSSTW